MKEAGTVGRGRRGRADPVRTRRASRPLPPIALLLLVAAHVVSSQTAAPDARFERIASVVQEAMKTHGVPGAALGISHRGARLTRGFGVTSVENPLPVNERTLFQAGSITKTFTATVVMRLADEGQLRLDAPVRDYLPTFRVRDENASQRATVRTLLTHMGGWEGDLFADLGGGDDALGAIVEQMAGLEQIAPLGSIWSYNNAGFYAAGRLIETATGKSYEAAVKDLLLDPVGLRQTFLFPSDAMTYRFAVGHAGPPGKPIVMRPWPLPRALNPAGGIIASVDDILRYGEFHLGDGAAPGGGRILSQGAMRQLHATQVVKQGTDEEMALGWQVARTGAFEEVWHDGAAVGQMALLVLVPSERLAVALLTNSVWGERVARAVRRAVAAEYLSTAIAPPAPVPVPRRELAEYAGRYTRPFMDVVVTIDADRVMVQRIQRQGFPAATSPVPPAARPAPYAFYAKDRLVELDPADGDRAEFIRDAEGAIGWIRVMGRLARRLPP
jgi:CubicO group peptidase (beta-lactamase class C family)